eukprot:scaffold1414_cov384-Prasinococcus_capsulatus_cf.AAC.3
MYRPGRGGNRRSVPLGEGTMRTMSRRMRTQKAVGHAADQQRAPMRNEPGGPVGGGGEAHHKHAFL